MQAYKGLDLVTNKVIKSEMNGIEHTLFDFRDIKDEYIVTEWVTDAISEVCIQELLRLGQLIFLRSKAHTKVVSFPSQWAGLPTGYSTWFSPIDLRL